MKTFFIFALLLLQRSLSMETKSTESSDSSLSNNYDTSSTENSIKDKIESSENEIYHDSHSTEGSRYNTAEDEKMNFEPIPKHSNTSNIRPKKRERSKSVDRPKESFDIVQNLKKRSERFNLKSLPAEKQLTDDLFKKSNDNEFLEQLERAKEDSKNDDSEEWEEDSMNDDSEKWEEHHEHADYAVDLVQKQQEQDEAEKEANLKLAARERYPSHIVAEEWINKAFFLYGDCFKRENFLCALARYRMSHEDVYFAFETFGDERACQYLDEGIADEYLTHKIQYLGELDEYWFKYLLDKFGFQLKPGQRRVKAKYFNIREHWINKRSERGREFKRFLRKFAKLQDLFENQGKNMKILIGSFLDMKSRFNLARTSKTLLENSGLLGKHMCVCMYQGQDVNFNAEFGPKDFKMIGLCIKSRYDSRDYDFSPKDLLADASIEMILQDQNDGWLKYTFKGEIKVPEKGINIEIVNRETFDVNHDMSEKNTLKNVVLKQEKINGKPDQKATISIICKILNIQNSILKLHLQK